MSNEPYDSGWVEPKTDAPAVRWLLALNIGVYLLQVTLVSPERIFGTLALDPATFPRAWWTPFSYMFVHAGVLHLGMNMLTLWMFGPRLEQAWTSRRFVPFYIWCGLGGALAHLLFSPNAALVGASAAIMGILLAYALRWPDERIYVFFIPTRARWLVLWLIAINVALGLSSQTLIGWVAHLGGLAFGWLYLLATSSGGLGRWIRAVPDAPDPMPRPVPRARVAAEQGEDFEPYPQPVISGAARTTPAGRPRVEPAVRSAQLNLILEKISRQGLESLTDAERKLLEDASRKLRETTRRG